MQMLAMFVILTTTCSGFGTTATDYLRDLIDSTDDDIDEFDPMEGETMCYNATTSFCWKCKDYGKRGVASDDPVLMEHYIQVFRHLIVELKWTTAVIISDKYTDSVVDRLSQVLTDANCRYIHYVIQPSSSDVMIETWINDTYHNRGHTGLHYIVIADEVNTQRIAKLAGEYDLKDKGKTALHFFSKWIFIAQSHGVEVVLQNIGELDHVTLIALQENEVKQTDNQTRPEACFAEQTTLMEGYCNSNGVDVLTVYYKPEGKQFCCVGFWNNLTLELMGDIFPNTKFGFNNRTLKVGTNMWPPFVYRSVDNGTETFTGYTMELLREVAHTLNFSYTLQVPEDKEWGAFREGRWTGLVGDLYYGNVDLVAAPIAQTTFREEGCDFTYPYFYEFSVIIIRMPDPESTKWRALLDIFSWQILLLVFLSLPIIAAVVYGVEKVNTRPWKRQYFMHQPVSDFISAAWYLFGALLTQGGLVSPRTVSGRTVVGFWWLYCIVLTATFTGQLMATLTVTSVRPPFNDMAEMVKQGDYRWGTAGGGTVISVSLESSKDRIFQKVWQGILKFFDEDPEVLDSDLYVHYKKVKEGSYAYLTDKSGVLELLGANCNLKLLKEEFFPTQYAFALPEGSPFVDMFSRRIFIVQESGLLKIWEKNWWPRLNCTDLPRTQAVSMGLVDVQSAYYLLVAGIGAGIIALGMEAFKNKADRRRLKRPTSLTIVEKRVNQSQESSVANQGTNDLSNTIMASSIQDRFAPMVYKNIDGQTININSEN